MATQKPLSTISYNTEPFLREKLNTWISSHIIQAYQYICHKGEDGDKDHIHVRIEPNKKLDPMALTEALKEYDPKHPDKPLCVRPWRPSKEEDWILYAEHDKDYLRLKYGGGEKGEKLPYKWQDVKASDGYDVEVMHIRAKSALEHTSSNLTTRIQRGEKPQNLLLEGENVYVVNAIMRAMQSSDYQRMAAEYAELQKSYEKLENAIQSAGFMVMVTDDGEYRLEPIGTGKQMTIDEWEDHPDKEHIGS